MTSEERVMRAREVLAGRYAGGLPTYSRSETLYPESVVLRAMLTFSDEGSGIGELRDALTHADEWLTNQRHTRDCAWRDDDHCDCGLTKLIRHIDEALALSQSS